LDGFLVSGVLGVVALVQIGIGVGHQVEREELVAAGMG